MGYHLLGHEWMKLGPSQRGMDGHSQGLLPIATMIVATENTSPLRFTLAPNFNINPPLRFRRKRRSAEEWRFYPGICGNGVSRRWRYRSREFAAPQAGLDTHPASDRCNVGLKLLGR